MAILDTVLAPVLIPILLGPFDQTYKRGTLSAILLEDGVSFLLLEDGVSYLLLE